MYVIIAMCGTPYTPSWHAICQVIVSNRSSASMAIPRPRQCQTRSPARAHTTSSTQEVQEDISPDGEIFEMGTTLMAARTENLMIRDCPFCRRTHRSPYVDVLEDGVMACRAKAPPWKRGSLDAWVDLGLWPVSEIEAFCGP